MRFTTEFPQQNLSRPLPSHPPSHEHENCDPAPDQSETPREEYSALLARATNDALRDWDVKTDRLLWPQGLEKLFGYPASAVTGGIAFWEEQLHPRDRRRVLASIRAALNSKAENWSGEYRFRRADGGYADLLERALIVRDENGAPLRFVGSLMDITARKQMQNQLCRSQRMEAFGQLASGVAHDFNNFLTAMLGYSDLLLGEKCVKGTIAEYVSEIRGAAQRASALTTQLLAFSRRTPLEPRVLEVNRFVANLERSMLRLLGENIGIECRFERALAGCFVEVDPGELTQIILNLVVNARDAMPTGGRLTLSTESVALGADTLLEPCDALPAGEYILLSISDNGIGMSDEVKQHLFEPFFTTKDDGNSGLGLATSYGIVRQSDGHIAITSELGKGTTVKIYLPQVPAPPAPNYQKTGAPDLPCGRETILVLEDDIAVRHISVKLLRSLGYDVIEAASGDDAQSLIEQRRGEQIDLLLTDMVMPQMSGRDFANWLGQKNPHTPVIFISGYLPESLFPKESQAHGKYFLAKPFGSEQLAQKIRSVLDAARTAR